MNIYCNSYIPFGMYLSVENNMFLTACIPLGMHPDRMHKMVCYNIRYQEMHP